MSLRLLVAAAFAASTLAQTTGSIQGTALDAAGKRSTETLVRVIRLRPTRWTSPSVQTSASGAFTIPALAPGEYVLCAMVDPVKLQVDPCFWLDPARKAITVAAGQSITAQQVRLEAGRKITVRVKDPEQLLKSAQPTPTKAGTLPRAFKVELAGPPGAILREIGVVRFEPGGVQVHEILVPSVGSARLRVHAQSIILRDAGQRAVANSRFDQPINQASEFEFQIGAN